MAGPSVIIDLDKIEKNTRCITRMCSDYGVAVTAVSKGTCGMPQVARAMLHGGASGIGESRMKNVHRLRANGIVAEVMLLRIPPLSGIQEIVRSVDISLNSELYIIRSLSMAAQEQGLIHKILMMIDLGDLREGFWRDGILKAAQKIVKFPNIKLQGIGTNLTCYGGIIPTQENMQSLVDWAFRIEDVTGMKIETISGGNTSSLPLLAAGKMPGEINNLRIGEAILLGRETIHRSVWPGTSQDAFSLRAEVIELKEKPSIPVGEIGQDAFGHIPTFQDRGEMMRAILNIGREDVDVEGLTPLDDRLSILGASSDHLLIDVTPLKSKIQLGDNVEFNLNYAALLAAMTSTYVDKIPSGNWAMNGKYSKVKFFGSSLIQDDSSSFLGNLEDMGYSLNMQPVSADDMEHFEKAFEDFLRNDGLPIVYAEEQLTIQSYRIFSRTTESNALVWISPYASITDTYSGSNDLGQLLNGGYENAPAVDTLVLIGTREADRQEADYIHSLGISVYTMEDVDLLGIEAVMQKALKKAAIGSQGLYVYFNKLICDRGQEGLSIRETHLMLETIARSGFLRVFDISGTRVSESEMKRLRNFTASVLGKRILG